MGFRAANANLKSAAVVTKPGRMNEWGNLTDMEEPKGKGTGH